MFQVTKNEPKLEQIIMNGFKNFLTLSRWILDHKVVCKQIKGAYV